MKKKGFNPKSLSNLKPPQKGERRNPNGRGAGNIAKVTKELKAIIQTQFDEEVRDGLSNIELLIKAMYSKALKGDQRAAEFLIERVYGKTPTQIDGSISAPDENIVGFNITIRGADSEV